MDLPDPGIEWGVPALQADSLSAELRLKRDSKSSYLLQATVYNGHRTSTGECALTGVVN